MPEMRGAKGEIRKDIREMTEVETMNLDEAIKTAIEYETKVRDVYFESMDQAKDPVGKRVLQVLVNEEQGHLDYLQNRLEEWESTGEITVEILESVIPSKRMIEDKVTTLKKKLETTPSDKKFSEIELQILKKALKVEEETSEFYKRMVQELPEHGQELFLRFVEIEEGHKVIVQAEIDSVTMLGYWFDMPEFDLSSA